MKTTVIAASLSHVRPWSLLERMSDFVSLMKPRVMLLAVFTAVVGQVIAPVHLKGVEDASPVGHKLRLIVRNQVQIPKGDAIF